MIRRKVFLKTGLFDRQFERQRMGDCEFGFRAYCCGFRSVSNPLAKRVHLKVKEGGLRETGSWDAYRPTKWFAALPIPSVLYFYRRYFGNSVALNELIYRVPPSIMPYWLKGSRILKILSIPITILVLPKILVQVARSWWLASAKLREGPSIETLAQLSEVPIHNPSHGN
jgi:GT2 family glycosyltransferase